MSARFYYIKPTGETGGPVDAEQLKAFRKAGLLKDDLVCREGDQRWFNFSDDLLGDTPPPAVARPAAPKVEEPQKVRVIDLDMPFGSMVVFMVKWAIAAIPAFIILMVIGFLLSLIFGSVLAVLAAGVR